MDNATHVAMYFGSYLKKPPVSMSRLEHYAGRDEIIMRYRSHRTKQEETLTLSDHHAVDAWMMWDPLLSSAEYDGQLRVVGDGRGRVNNHQFYLTHREFAAHSADLLHTLLEAVEQTGRYIDGNSKEACVLLATEVGLAPQALSNALVRRSHQTKRMDLAVIREQQTIADRFYALGLLPRAVKVREALWHD